jgi:hypothetical protein
MCNTDWRCVAWNVLPSTDAAMNGPSCNLISRLGVWTPTQLNIATGYYCGTTQRPRFGVDRWNSGTTGATDLAFGPARLRDEAGFTVMNFSVYIDHSIVEAFLDNGTARVASRVYNPLATGSMRVVFKDGAGAPLTGVEVLDSRVWEVGSIWAVPPDLHPPSGALAIGITAIVVAAFLAVTGVFALRQWRRERNEFKRLQ